MSSVFEVSVLGSSIGVRESVLAVSFLVVQYLPKPNL